MCSSISCLYIVFSNCIALVIMPRTLPWAENAGLHYPQATDALLSSWFLTNWTKPSQSNPVTREPDMSGGRVNPTSRHIDYDSMFFYCDNRNVPECTIIGGQYSTHEIDN